MEERVTINAGNPSLEGVFYLPDEGRAVGGMVICHPHPQYGGDMHNNVVLALHEAAREAGYASLRFNFRGVGASQGSYEGGTGEKEDVSAAIGYLRERLGPDAAEVIVAGYSFGAYVGSAAAVEEKKVETCILVSPPVGMMDFDHLKETSIKVLFIAGDMDPYCPLQSLEAFRGEMPGENHLEIVPGADHFYFGMDAYITRCASEFL